MPDHDRTWRRRLGGDALQPADPLPRQRTELDPDVGRDEPRSRGIVRLDPHDARLLRRAKSEREHRPERDRHLAEEVAHPAAADNALDPVLELDGLHATFEHGEQGAPLTRVHRVLARHEPDVGRDAGKPFALDGSRSAKIETPAISSGVTMAGLRGARPPTSAARHVRQSLK